MLDTCLQSPNKWIVMGALLSGTRTGYEYGPDLVCHPAALCQHPGRQ